MTSAVSDLAPLPRLRPDLEIYPAPPARDGAPAFVIHDPVTGVYRHIGWAEALLLEQMRLPTTLGKLISAVRERSTLRLTEEQVVMFCQHARTEQLTLCSGTAPVDQLMKKASGGVTRWLLGGFLFFRIPLLKPDAFLTRTVDKARLLTSTLMISVYLCAWLAGLYFLTQRFDDFITTFTWFFNLQGLLYYGLAVIVVKTVHEFAHAYTAKSYGVRVPSMGIALLMFWPVAFCDVTDAWKLDKRTRRLWISGAGIAAELVLGGIALAAWGMLTPGLLKSIAFVVSSTTIISTVLVNLNPAIRFDGYYLLCDLWGIDNLRQRSDAMTKWALRNFLFGISADPPERLPLSDRVGLVVYGVYSWLYRIGLYLGIAALVYYKFTKVIGIILFVTEIIMFLVRPVVVEAKIIYGHLKKAGKNWRMLVTLSGLMLLFLWFALPLPRRLGIPALIISEESEVIYVPSDGYVEKVWVHRDAEVKKDDPLVRIVSDKVRADVEIMELDEKAIEGRLLGLSADPELRKDLPRRREELAEVRARLRMLRERLKRNTVTSRQDGAIIEWDETLRPGRFVGEGRRLGRVANRQMPIVVGFLAEEYVESIDEGDGVTFLSSCGAVRGTVVRKQRFREETLDYMPLASINSGDLPVVRTSGGGLQLVGSYFKVEVRLTEAIPRMKLGATGNIWCKTRPRSVVADLLGRAWRVIVRESSF